MSNLFSELSSLWSAKAGARKRQSRRNRAMAAFHVLHDIHFAAPWRAKQTERCAEC